MFTKHSARSGHPRKSRPHGDCRPDMAGGGGVRGEKTEIYNPNALGKQWTEGLGCSDDEAGSVQLRSHACGGHAERTHARPSLTHRPCPRHPRLRLGLVDPWVFRCFQSEACFSRTIVCRNVRGSEAVGQAGEAGAHTPLLVTHCSRVRGWGGCPQPSAGCHTTGSPVSTGPVASRRASQKC